VQRDHSHGHDRTDNEPNRDRHAGDPGAEAGTDHRAKQDVTECKPSLTGGKVKNVRYRANNHGAQRKLNQHPANHRKWNGSSDCSNNHGQIYTPLRHIAVGADGHKSKADLVKRGRTHEKNDGNDRESEAQGKFHRTPRLSMLVTKLPCPQKRKQAKYRAKNRTDETCVHHSARSAHANS
jgi:hypothetical protein